MSKVRKKSAKADTPTRAERKAARSAQPLSARVKVRRKTSLPSEAEGKLLVSLPGGPQVVVDDVENNEEAWEKYKEVAGIVESDHKPRFAVPGEDLLINDQGVVVDEKGNQILGSTGGGNWDDEFLDEDDDDVE